MMRAFLLSTTLALAAAGAAAAPLSPLAHEVVLLGPQLERFAGSAENFESLARGFRLGSEVTLSTTAADGTRDIVTFTPAQPLAAMETARLLERARQLLISHGIGAPGAKEIGIALMGGVLAAPAGPVQLPGLVAADPKKPLAVTQSVFGGSAQNYRNLVDGLTGGSTVTLSTAGKPDTAFAAPGGAMSADEAKEAIRLASALLAAQGIHDPTPAQVRAALVGGTVVTPDKRSIALRGVLEGRTRATSQSPERNVSDVAPAPAAPPARRTSDTPGTGHTSDSRGTGHTSDSRGTGHTSDTKPRPPATK